MLKQIFLNLPTLQEEQLRDAKRAAPSVAISHLIGTLLALALAFHSTDSLTTAAWGALTLSVTASYWLSANWRMRASVLRSALLREIAFASALAIPWTMLGLMLVEISPETTAPITILLIVCLSSITSVQLSVIYPAAFAYVITLITPIALYYLFSQEALPLGLVAIALGMFLFILIFTVSHLLSGPKRPANVSPAENHRALEALAKEQTLLILRQAKHLKDALKQQENINDLQRSFITMASHEFRTPLAIIDSSAQKLKSRAETLSPADIVQRAETIRSAVKRMTDLMERILSAAKLESGHIALTLQNCDVQQVVNECCNRQREIDKSHRFNINFCDLPSVLADEKALGQVFANLLSNAVKYSPNATDIDVYGRQNGRYVIIEIKDHGIGIDEDDLPRLFGRFFRAKTAEGITGTGIGLSVVKHIIEQHDGDISVRSSKGEGTSFTVSLPIGGPGSTEADFIAALKTSDDQMKERA